MNRIFKIFLCVIILAGAAAPASALMVTRVVDGDTLVLDSGEKVRLIGVDTPETKHPLKPVEVFGAEAYDFTRSQIEGEEVRLEYDWEKEDKYGRLLAYVYRKKDDFFLNAEIIKQGFGFAYTYSPFKHLAEFRSHEKKAREGGVGLWKAALPRPAPAAEPAPAIRSGDGEEAPLLEYVGSLKSRRYHDPSCPWVKRIKAPNLIAFDGAGDAANHHYTPCALCQPAGEHAARGTLYFSRDV